MLAGGNTKTATLPVGKVAAYALTGLLLVFAMVEIAIIAGSLTQPDITVGFDLRMYLERTQDWLTGGDFYRPRQLAGAYEVTHGDSLYPPVLLYLTVPMTVLPWAVWWLVPLAVIGAAVAHSRPSPWQWVALAAILVYPRTWTILLYGNPAMWALAALAAGMVWRWPSAFVLLKVTFAPFALVGIRDRRWWYAAAAMALFAMPLGGLWLQFPGVLLNAQTNRGIEYTLGEWPIALLLVVSLAGVPAGWSSSQRGRRTSGGPALPPSAP
jgi:hypothetical protein